MKTSLLQAYLILFITAFSLSCTRPRQRADYQTVPLPQQIALHAGKPFVLNQSTRILVEEGNEKMQRNAEFLQAYIKEMTGLETAVRHDFRKEKNAIVLLLKPSGQPPKDTI